MIAIGSDHGGYELKEKIKQHLSEQGVEFKDYGTDSAESCHYPIYGEAVARAVADGKAEKGVVVCSTGIGISIAANKVRGVRCAVCGDSYSAEYCRRHNDANVLALGALVTGSGLALKIVDIFLSTEAEGGRHAARRALIADIEDRERSK